MQFCKPLKTAENHFDVSFESVLRNDFFRQLPDDFIIVSHDLLVHVHVITISLSFSEILELIFKV